MGWAIEDIPILKDIIEMLYAKRDNVRLKKELKETKKELRECQYQYIVCLREKRKKKDPSKKQKNDEGN